MAIETRVVIYIFPCLVLGSGLKQSTLTLLEDYSKAGMGGVELHECSEDATRSTVLGYVSSFIWLVEVGQYPVGGFVNTQVFNH